MTYVSIYSTTTVASTGLGVMVDSIKGIQVRGTYSNLRLLEQNLLEQQEGAADTNIILLELAPSINSAVIRRICSVAPKAPVVLWTGMASAEFLSQAIESGARGIIGKESAVDLLAECLGDVAAGKSWIDRDVSRRLASLDTIKLTPRQRQLMGLLAQGLRNKEIGWSLGVTESTIKVYLSHLFVKTGVSSRLELALLALKNVVSNAKGVPERSGVQAGDRIVPLPIPQYVNRERVQGAL
jgi:DNA-binding NarL/FixJ family response regulator